MMSRRFKVGTFFGVTLFLHWTFFLLPAWMAYLEWSFGGNWIDIGLTTVLIGLLFTCVILHEYGHVLAARASVLEHATSRCFPLVASLGWNECPKNRGRN